ncbi:MAG TPA: hypothetical protein VL588_12135 [Bdellovibrionota bacterium]|nr:hypothetical protein [Bdellovibrionota bacterium]
MTLQEVLRAKNRCLSRFWQVTDTFRREAGEGRWEGLGAFHRERDYILKSLDALDAKATEAATKLRAEERTEALKEELRSLLRERDLAIAEIFRLDSIVIELIENERERTEASLGASLRGRSIIGKFKSGGGPRSGREVDGEV